MTNGMDSSASTGDQAAGESTAIDLAAGQPELAGSDEQRTRLIESYVNLVGRGEIYYPVQYRFVRELGRGRQGIVFLALRHGARGCVTRHAIKVFDPSIYPDAPSYWTDMGRIASQTSSMQTIQSPHLVDLDSYDEVDGIGFTQEEVINGIDLDQLTAGVHLDRVRTRFAVREWARLNDVLFRPQDDHLRIQPGIAIYIMRMVLRGLETLHKKGFVHGDIKPSNIMVDRVGTVQVVDFGRAARANERTRILFGSPLYMAPEVHRREPTQIHSDIFSIGLVGIVLLSGKKTVFRHVMSEQDLLEFKLTLASRLGSLLPPYVLENHKLVALLQRFVAPNVKDRFPDAQTAESDAQGLRMVHKQLTLSGKDSDYGREISTYVSAVDLDFWDTVTIQF
jgi:eukaryotic-like serine/threonine-protein kinase